LPEPGIGDRAQALIKRCCGLDVHQETVVACLLIGTAGARARKEVRTFRTVRRELEALRDRLTAAEATHVGMESTGVYWRPVYAVLEGHVELIVGNACASAWQIDPYRGVTGVED
jgi:transposase